MLGTWFFHLNFKNTAPGGRNVCETTFTTCFHFSSNIIVAVKSQWLQDQIMLPVPGQVCYWCRNDSARPSSNLFTKSIFQMNGEYSTLRNYHHTLSQSLFAKHSCRMNATIEGET